MRILDEVETIVIQLIPSLDVIIPLLMFGLLALRGNYFVKVAVLAINSFSGLIALGLITNANNAWLMSRVYVAFFFFAWLFLTGLRLDSDGGADWFGIQIYRRLT